MHYFGTMSLLRSWSDGKLMLVATLLLISAWNVPVLGVLIIPAFVLLLELAHRPKKRFLKLYAVMAIWNGATTYWVAYAPESHGLGVVATTVINGALMAGAIWLGMRSSILWSKFPRVAQYSLLAYLPFIATWIAFEKLHDHWGMAFPWLNLGNTFNALPMFVQWYKWLGVTGGTLWVLMVAMAAYEWLSGRWRKSRPIFLFLAPLMISVTLWFLPQHDLPIGSVKVAVVQPNFHVPDEKFSIPEGKQIQKVQSLLSAHLGEERVDLIVLPETFLPNSRELSSLGFTTQGINQMLDGFGNAAIFGATTFDFQDTPNVYNKPYGSRYKTSYNSAIFHVKGSQSPSVYHKGKLVVGAETMPFVKYLKPLLGDLALELGGTSGSFGVSRERKVFESGDKFKLAPIICWENEFSDYTTDYVRNGANLLAVITNDGWWGNTRGHVQHMRFSGLRAIENGRWIVRSANTGISCIIDPKGRVHEPLGWDEEGVIMMDVPLLEGRTLYSRTGDWIGRFMVMLFVVNLFLLLFTRFFRLKPR